MDPKTNLLYAGKYLKLQLDRYDGNTQCGLSAYNGGKCLKAKDGHIINIRYVRKVLLAWVQNR